MALRHLAGLVGGSAVWLATSLSQAQCSKDTDCKGDRICEGGACVAAPLPAAPAAPAGAAAAPVPAASVEAAPAEAAPAPALAPASTIEPPYASLDEPRLSRKRHSTGMMAGGIVMVSFVPVALLVSLVANAQQKTCEAGDYYFDGGSYNYSTIGTGCSDYDPTIYGGLISAAVLLGVGIPMIVIGGKREPIVATVTPWATAQAGGLGLHIAL